ncbi:MAG: DegT/DnrJ/EryC1/StrS family aminotransferase [Gemmatimonadaceae bacterium]|nr:DegT/DnrJ/EryC1/StrS family aminotransferase [Gemmatimonadaceae bacterium]
MAVPLLDLKAQHATIRDDVVAALMQVVDQQAFILGDPVTQLETEVAALSQVPHAVGCANGTDAILLALRALGVGQGDEVITTPFTFFATGGAIHNVGARPVFVDIDPRTFNIAPSLVTPAITARTKAVIAVDLFGQMAAIEEVTAAAKGVPVIEDAAQSIGASRVVNGRKVMAGEGASIGTFSFFPSKNLGGYGDGGMMVTGDDALFEALMKLRTHGSRRTYYHEIVGYNSRLDALQAAVLRAKLPHLEGWSAARRRNAAYYDAAFADLSDVTTPYIEPANTSIYNQYTIRTASRDALQAHLKAQGIGSNVYYPLSLHLQPCFAYLGYTEGQCPEAERASKEVLSLPVYPELTTQQLDEVIAAVRGFFGR